MGKGEECAMRAKGESTSGGSTRHVIPDKSVVPAMDAKLTRQAEKRAQQARYRYTSPTPEGGGARKRKAAADFI
jgi:hypothetical protein